MRSPIESKGKKYLSEACAHRCVLIRAASNYQRCPLVRGRRPLLPAFIIASNNAIIAGLHATLCLHGCQHRRRHDDKTCAHLRMHPSPPLSDTKTVRPDRIILKPYEEHATLFLQRRLRLRLRENAP